MRATSRRVSCELTSRCPLTSTTSWAPGISPVAAAIRFSVFTACPPGSSNPTGFFSSISMTGLPIAAAATKKAAMAARMTRAWVSESSANLLSSPPSPDGVGGSMGATSETGRLRVVRVRVVMPAQMVSPGSTGVGARIWRPLTNVPLVEPRSSMTRRPPTSVSRACSRDSWGSSSFPSASAARPMTNGSPVTWKARPALCPATTLRMVPPPSPWAGGFSVTSRLGSGRR